MAFCWMKLAKAVMLPFPSAALTPSVRVTSLSLAVAHVALRDRELGGVVAGDRLLSRAAASCT
jgi:hypothetical protein